MIIRKRVNLLVSATVAAVALIAAPAYVSATPACVSAAQSAMSAPQTDVSTTQTFGAGFKRINVAKDGSVVRVTLTIDAGAYSPASNRAVTLVPVLRRGADSVMLKPVVISGRRRYYAWQRANGGNGAGEGWQLERYRKGSDIEYAATTAFRPWMNGEVQLDISEEWCGCGGHADEYRCGTVLAVTLAQPGHKPVPMLKYIVPRPETVKTRSETATAYLDFPVGTTAIRPEYRRNAQELAKILATIERLDADHDLTIGGITIHGYASPEGKYELNLRLARGRADALCSYVAARRPADRQKIKAAWTAEDWDGLRLMADSSTVARRADVMRIASSDAAPDEKERRLKALDGGSTFGTMILKWFPALRRSEYTVTYTVRKFNVDEAKEIIKVRPQKLSLNEMYLVAAQYEPGSDEFDRVFDVAVRMFPEDETANLNAANIALKDCLADKAEAHLLRAGSSPEAVNARGVLAMLRGNTADARRLLEQARTMGVEEAAHNLSELDMMENKQ